MERESHLKDFANLRAFEAKKGNKRLSNELTAQQRLGSTSAKATHSRLPSEVQARIDAPAAGIVAAGVRVEKLEAPLHDDPLGKRFATTQAFAIL